MDKQQLIHYLKQYLQKQSFIDLLSVGDAGWNISCRRDLATIRQWKTSHEKEYSHLKADVMHASYGDYTAYQKIFKLAVTCIPQSIMQDINYVMTGVKTPSIDPDMDAFIKEMNNIEGYVEFNRAEMECDLDISIEEMHLDIVPKKRNEDKFFYQRIPNALEFFYNLPWDWQCAMRTLMPDATDMEMACISRSLYMKIYFMQEEIITGIRKIGKKSDNFTMSLMYFIFFDHGLKTAYNALTHSFALEQNLGMFNKTVIPTLKHLISASIENGQDSKASWRKEIQSDINDINLRDSMLTVVKNVKGISGRPRTATNIIMLKDLLVNDVPQVMKLIKEYRKICYRPVDLAYLFIILHRSGHTTEAFYSVFHHAMEQYEGMEYNLRNPQEVYNNFPADDEILKKHGTTHQKNISKMLNEWVTRFTFIRKTA